MFDSLSQHMRCVNEIKTKPAGRVNFTSKCLLVNSTLKAIVPNLKYVAAGTSIIYWLTIQNFE